MAITLATRRQHASLPHRRKNISESLISVIVPIYNAQPYLEQCLNSIVGQTYKNLEIILLNDGSTDDSLTTIPALPATTRASKLSISRIKATAQLATAA